MRPVARHRHGTLTNSVTTTGVLSAPMTHTHRLPKGRAEREHSARGAPARPEHSCRGLFEEKQSMEPLAGYTPTVPCPQ